MYLFNRSITVNIRSIDGKSITVDGFFLDSHHELCLTLGVDLESNTITSAEGEFRRAPHSDCGQTQEKIKKLIGVNLNRYVRKQIQAAVGLEQGCTHLTDLTLECVKGIIQAKFRLMHLNMETEDIQPQVQQYLAGSCRHYKKS
ncbi:DUF2889 domain-containing protein [Desulfosporosinus metallidurans]|uniref:DUF2889 domain-containing protein n=1 Tax=Desulfosporosinus metallidurans TaxID=1888891 RepID=A0A1Q8R302_9FIRM|nr:DUF2889 domain-containing protein [Desulfosporosinus metallidurans]OLN34006.1 hypothetical protein DSOL_0184 [Desulfosporosinus metallidurans]